MHHFRTGRHLRRCRLPRGRSAGSRQRPLNGDWLPSPGVPIVSRWSTAVMIVRGDSIFSCRDARRRVNCRPPIFFGLSFLNSEVTCKYKFWWRIVSWEREETRTKFAANLNERNNARLTITDLHSLALSFSLSLSFCPSIWPGRSTKTAPLACIHALIRNKCIIAELMS